MSTSVVVKTKTEAARRLRALRADAESGTPVRDGNLTVAQLIAEWVQKGLPARNLQPASIGSQGADHPADRTRVGGAS